VVSEYLDNCYEYQDISGERILRKDSDSISSDVQSKYFKKDLALKVADQSLAKYSTSKIVKNTLNFNESNDLYNESDRIAFDPKLQKNRKISIEDESFINSFSGLMPNCSNRKKSSISIFKNNDLKKLNFQKQDCSEIDLNSLQNNTNNNEDQDRSNQIAKNNLKQVNETIEDVSCWSRKITAYKNETDTKLENCKIELDPKSEGLSSTKNNSSKIVRETPNFNPCNDLYDENNRIERNQKLQKDINCSSDDESFINVLFDLMPNHYDIKFNQKLQKDRKLSNDDEVSFNLRPGLIINYSNRKKSSFSVLKNNDFQESIILNNLQNKIDSFNGEENNLNKSQDHSKEKSENVQNNLSISRKSIDSEEVENLSKSLLEENNQVSQDIIIDREVNVPDLNDNQDLDQIALNLIQQSIEIKTTLDIQKVITFNIHNDYSYKESIVKQDWNFNNLSANLAQFFKNTPSEFLYFIDNEGDESVNDYINSKFPNSLKKLQGYDKEQCNHSVLEEYIANYNLQFRSCDDLMKCYQILLVADNAQYDD
jgi:hypothetical protein